MAKVYGVVAHKRRGAEGGTWCFSPTELETAHRQAMLWAIEDLHALKDPEPLAYQFERKNPYFMEYPEACDAATLAIRGRGFKGRGRKRQIEDLERNERICLAVYFLEQAGIPIKGDVGTGSACELIAERVHLSSDRVFGIWNDDGEPQNRDFAPWEYLEIDAPSVSEIIDYCLKGEFRENEKDRLIIATIRHFTERKSKQKQ